MLDEYLKQNQSVFQVGRQNNALAQKFKIESFPTTVLIGADGKIGKWREGVSRIWNFPCARRWNIRAQMSQQREINYRDDA